ncbi:MAG TPA: hypothetical protein VI796_01445, partial [Candidatus Thermoplasmatota archaeon]|nr:hypothetical protein [Candidatus Thermoplasmatota archaeon]
MPSAALYLEILAALGRTRRLRDLNDQAGLSYAQGYRTSHDLAERGLVRLRRKGGELRVEAAEPRLVRLAREVLAR